MPADGRYELLREIGRGATSCVWLARDRRAGSHLALKLGRDPKHRALLADEAERLTLIESSQMPAVLDAGLIHLDLLQRSRTALPFVALEWVDGTSLGAVEQELGVDVTLSIARDLASALADLHDAGWAHGDVKPANVVLRAEPSPGGTAMLLDFGLGAPAAEVAPRGATLRYLAPEATRTPLAGDGRARDTWALGLTLSEIFSGAVRRAEDPAAAARAAALPRGLREILLALLSEAPAARPSAEWVRRMATAVLGKADSTAPEVERRRRRVRRTYLSARSRALSRVARGAAASIGTGGIPGEWLRDASRRLSSVAALRGTSPAGPVRFENLTVLERSRWLVQLIGADVSRWPSLGVPDDSDLVERLLALCATLDPAAITYADLVSEPRERIDRIAAADPIHVALEVARPGVRPAVLDAAERLVFSSAPPPAFVVETGRALRRRGELARALAVLECAEGEEARVEAAEAARKSGDVVRAEALLARDARDPADPAVRSRAAACRARMLLDRGDAEAAFSLLSGTPETSASCEVLALVELARGNPTRATSAAERGLALTSDEEERCRLEAVLGNVAHAAGDPGAALSAFRRAFEHAVRAGAVLEEATYATGVAAAALDAGHLAESLEGARRAALLFEHLRRPVEAARALLARAAAFSAAGATQLCKESAEAAMERARQGGDVRCRAFAHLILADTVPPGDLDGVEHAQRAASLLEAFGATDRVRAASRLLRRHALEDLAPFDSLCESGALSATARLDWWGARAERAANDTEPIHPSRVLAELSKLAPVPAPVGARRLAFESGAALAARVGDGDLARAFTRIAGEALRQLAQGAPPELRGGLASARASVGRRADSEDALSADQIADIESLVHALGERDRLRPLLEQALDALVLWTGVERGLLLLRAPGDKLVPRAARNLARGDLSQEQLGLSRTLAERALESGEPVVAVDASGELPEVHESVHALKLRSVLAVPLLARGEAIGVVYLDDRVRRGAFGPRELSWVRLVATLAAVAIADARDQVLLRRSARRARRAEAALLSALARKDAALDVAERELARRDERATRFSYEGIVGSSEPLRTVLRLVDRVTQSEVPVLVVGESGSGKELIARAIHRNGPRAGEPFVSENCGAIPEGLLESALFGHVRGAFTGAARPRAGLFEVANGGTLFLDEVGEMSLAMQTKLLRVLEDGEVRPIGSERARRVDVRVVAATHRDLAALVEAGKFREDLFYRLNVISVALPPLRERRADIPLLVSHFVEKHARGRPIRIGRAAMDALVRAPWPGNVRQLENEIRRALVLADDTVTEAHLSQEVLESGRDPEDTLNLRRRVDRLEFQLVRAALERTGGNQTRAAELLGLSRFGLQKMMKRLDISAGTLQADPGSVTGGG